MQETGGEDVPERPVIPAGVEVTGDHAALIAGLKKANITLDRKVLAELAVNEPAAFTAYWSHLLGALARPVAGREPSWSFREFGLPGPILRIKNVS